MPCSFTTTTSYASTASYASSASSTEFHSHSLLVIPPVSPSLVPPGNSIVDQQVQAVTFDESVPPNATLVHDNSPSEDEAVNAVAFPENEEPGALYVPVGEVPAPEDEPAGDNTIANTALELSFHPDVLEGEELQPTASANEISAQNHDERVPELISTGNIQTMVTRSKEGIFKPKAYHLQVDEVPNNVHEALKNFEWKNSSRGII
ncbi:hypothetical protein V6N13_053297 [Hibiscus sabdariffa]